MREGFVDVQSGRFRWLEWGPDDQDAPTLLLLHGFNQTAHSFEEVAARLDPRLRLIAYDQRGHGRSQWASDGDYGREAMTEDARQVAVARGLSRFVVAGMSMGAVHAIMLASRHPQHVEALIVIDYAPEVETIGVDRIKMVLMHRWDDFESAVAEVHRFNPRRELGNIRSRLGHTLRQMPDGRWAWAIDPALAISPRFGVPPETMWQEVESVRCPALLIRGAESDLVTQAKAEEFVRRLRDGRLGVVADAGHSVPGDNPAACAARIDDFVAPFVRDSPAPGRRDLSSEK